MRELSPADHVVRDAFDLNEADRLAAELWASDHLGQAWALAAIGADDAESRLGLAVAGRAATRQNPRAHLAAAALRLVAAPADRAAIDEALAGAPDATPVPWTAAPEWRPVSAHRAVDVWESERVLLVDFDGDHPHGLMARILEVGGRWVAELALLRPGSLGAFDDLIAEGPLRPPVACDPADALADLADAMQTTDMTWPRHDGEEYADLRALAWSRCRAYLPEWSEPTFATDKEREALIEAFVADAEVPDDETTRSLADLFLEYGDGWLPVRPLGWNPGSVMLFLTDWLPRKAVLDAAQREALPDILARWVAFALARRDVPPEWISPVVAAVSEHRAEFEDAFGDAAAWGPATEIAAQLAERGVDFTDRDAVDAAVRALNAENLARRIQEGP